MSELREVTAISELKEANNDDKSTYVNLTFGCMVVDDVILKNEVRSLFCDAKFAKLLKPGLKMVVEPIVKK